MDFRRGDPSKTKSLFKGSHAKGEGDKGYKSYNVAKEGSSAASTSKYKGRDKRKEFKPKTSCFLCDGPHWARECPKKKALNAMIEKEVKLEGDAHMGVNVIVECLEGQASEGATSKHVATPEPDSIRLANSNRNPDDAHLIILFYILLSFLFQKCRDPNPRLDPKGGSEPEPGLLRRFHLSYQNIYLCHFVLRFSITRKHFQMGGP